jgi:hypothetical protein
MVYQPYYPWNIGIGVGNGMGRELKIKWVRGSIYHG